MSVLIYRKGEFHLFLLPLHKGLASWLEKRIKNFQNSSFWQLRVNWLCKITQLRPLFLILWKPINWFSFCMIGNIDFNPFLHDVEKLSNMIHESCGVHTRRFLKCVWPWRYDRDGNKTLYFWNLYLFGLIFLFMYL